MIAGGRGNKGSAGIWTNSVDLGGAKAGLSGCKGKRILAWWLGTCSVSGECKGKHMGEVGGEIGEEMRGLEEMGL